MTAAPSPVPPMRVGARHRSRIRRRLLVAAYAGGAIVVVLLLALVIGGPSRARFAGAVVGGSAVGFWPAITTARQFVRFDVDGSYLRVRNGVRPVRIPLREIERFAFPDGASAWSVPYVLRSHDRPVPMRALQRVDLGPLDNLAEVDVELAALHAELAELRYRWLDGP